MNSRHLELHYDASERVKQRDCLLGGLTNLPVTLRADTGASSRICVLVFHHPYCNGRSHPVLRPVRGAWTKRHEFPKANRSGTPVSSSASMIFVYKHRWQTAALHRFPPEPLLSRWLSQKSDARWTSCFETPDSTYHLAQRA
jgi:hypothetical protein